MLNKNTVPIITALITSMFYHSASAETRVIKGANTLGSTVYPAIVNIDMDTIKKRKIWQPGDPIKAMPFGNGMKRDPSVISAERGFGKDPLATKQELSVNNFGASDLSDPIINVEGSPFNGIGVADTTGDIGPNFFVQSVNTSGPSSEVFIINKTDGTVAAEFNLATLSTGSGTGCAGGIGDPIIFYDQFVDNGPGEDMGRWVLTEFTNNSFCIYISQTTDPTAGTWFVYEYISSTGGLPDYPKFGTWNDAYYVGANEGPIQYALDRENMIAGNPARPPQFFDGPRLPGFGFQHLMPADADGNIPPPDGAPGIFMRHRDSEYHAAPGAPDVLEIFEFSLDWDNPGNSTFTGPINIEVSEFDTNLGGTNFGDLSVPQPDGATNLFPLKQPLMWRLQHRTVNEKQYIVGNMVTDVDGNDLHGVRWFQLERPDNAVSEGWSLADEGTYHLGDTVNRWMASTAMDGDGNIAIGFNVSDTSTYPGMRYAGRLATDPPGTMPHGEISIIEGTTSSNNSRWGDYSSLSVDPVDECTFWYTAQYSNNNNWSTRIASFKFEQCGCLLSLDTVQVTGTSAIADNTIQIDWNDSTVAEITNYRVFRSTTPGSGYVRIATVDDSSMGTGGSGTYSYQDTDVSGGTEYYYIVRASDGGSCLSQPSNESSTVATGICTLDPVFSGVSSVNDDMQSQCSLTVNWSAAASQCGSDPSDIRYSVFRSENENFIPDNSNQIASDLTDLSFTDNDAGLISGTEYYYVVRSTDLDNNAQDDNLNTIAGSASGLTVPSIFNNNLDSFTSIADAENQGWTHAADQGTDDWRVETGDDNTTGTGSAFVSTDVASTSNKYIASKSLVPSATSVLSFFHKYDFELGSQAWDGAILEITTDGGENWTSLGPQITVGNYNQTVVAIGAEGWGGEQANFGEVQVDLSSFADQIVQIRWRMATDASVGAGDWKIDDIVVSNISAPGQCNIVDFIYGNGFEAIIP